MRLSKSRGAALLLALWALFLLAALIMSWALNIDSRLKISGSENRILEAQAMAASGAEVAMAPTIKPNSPNLHGRFGPRQTYSVRITGEGGRLNINWLVAGENPDRVEILRRYLEIKGIELNERERMIDCLLDWVDPDDLVRLNGAEAEEGYQPANALLVRVDELKKVKGWEAITSTPGWDDEFTVNSTGPVDMAWAPRDVLRALPGFTDQMVDRLLQLRAGPDGQDEVRVALGLSPQQFQQLSPFISFRDSVLRVVSTGRSSDITRVIQLVFRRAGTTPQLITWKEF
jgi:type II secretory pathway component PulK